jgi:predicted outer membrane repeat protein
MRNTLLLVLIFGLSACQNEDVASKLPIACALNSDCRLGLVCAIGRCRKPCAEARDCGEGGSCVSDGLSAVCQPLEEKERPCNYQGDCPLPLACAGDYRCRNQCRGDDDCNMFGIADRRCALDDRGVSFCAEPAEVDGGVLVSEPPVGTMLVSGGPELPRSLFDAGDEARDTGLDARVDAATDGALEASVVLDGATDAALTPSTPLDGGMKPSPDAAVDTGTLDAALGRGETGPSGGLELCGNGQLDGHETALDCGGPVCGKCPDESRCVYHSDCSSAACDLGVCKPKLQLSVQRSGEFSGRVLSTPSGIDCGGTCAASYAAGRTIKLEALPSLGAAFTGWSGGGCTGTGACIVTMTAALEVSAAFGPGPSNPYAWAKSIHGARSDWGYQAISTVAFDADGNALLAGQSGVFDFGGGPLSGGPFVAKYDSRGSYVWARQLTGGPNSFGSVAADGNGDVIVAGSCHFPVDLGDATIRTCSAFFAKYAADNGALRWLRCFPDEGNILARPAATGELVVVGNLGPTLDVGGQTLKGSFYIARYSGDGATLLSAVVGVSEGSANPTAFVIDASGSVIVAGQTNSATFGTVQLAAGAGFVAKYSPEGVVVWARRVVPTGTGTISALAVDKSGQTFFAGSFTGQFDPGDGPITAVAGRDIFLGKYDAEGRYQWLKRYGGAGDDNVAGVGVLPEGDVVFTGNTATHVDFGGGVLSGAEAGTSMFLARVSPAGLYRWSQGYDADNVTSLAIDASGALLLGGLYSGNVDFGGGALGQSDGAGFALRLTP